MASPEITGSGKWAFSVQKNSSKNMKRVKGFKKLGRSVRDMHIVSDY